MHYSNASNRTHNHVWSYICYMYRPVFIMGIKQTVDDAAVITSNWEKSFGIEIPTDVPCFYEVGADPECDATTYVPSCCLWSGSGLTKMPVSQSGVSPTDVLDQVWAHIFLVNELSMRQNTDILLHTLH